MKREASLQRFLHKVKQKYFIDEIEYGKLHPLVLLMLVSMELLKCTNSHSSDSFPKLRPIVSSIGTFNYKLACFVCDLLSSLFPGNFRHKDTFSFVSQIKNANLFKKFLVSYDLTSLFISMQLPGTTEIALNLIFNHNANRNITRKELEKLSC